MDSFSGEENPLLSASSRVWHDLIDAVAPATLLLIIENRMSVALRRATTAEDIFQEALAHAYRDRAKCEWRGLKSFRSWLLSIIDNRIREAADYHAAEKRGGGRPTPVFSTFSARDGTESGVAGDIGPAGSTTPSRVAIYREQARACLAALEALPDDVREVVRLRLFDQLTAEEIAAKLGIGLSAVRHRFRKGAMLYQQQLKAEMFSRSATISKLMAAIQEVKASPEEE